MPKYNTQFELNREELELIESALRERNAKLVDEKLEAANDNVPGELEQTIREGEELLGRLHNQKVFYRPKRSVYVGG